MSVKDNRKKLDKVLKQLDLTAAMYVVVGIPKSAPPREDDSSVTMAEVAFFHEFGTINAPERSFIRATVDKERDKYFRLQERFVDALYQGKIEPKKALGVLGEQAKADIQRTIAAGVPPANAESTIKRKGSSKTLVDTGALRQAIDYEIRGAR